MGGYAQYVWSSVGLTLLVLGFVVIAPIVKHRELLRTKRRQQRRNEQGAGTHEP